MRREVLQRLLEAADPDSLRRLSRNVAHDIIEGNVESLTIFTMSVARYLKEDGSPFAVAVAAINETASTASHSLRAIRLFDELTDELRGSQEVVKFILAFGEDPVREVPFDSLTEMVRTLGLVEYFNETTCRLSRLGREVLKRLTSE